MAVDFVPQLIQAGVQSFKIEGRLKGPEYVAITTRAYRQAIDEVWEFMKSQTRHSDTDTSDTDTGGIIKGRDPSTKNQKQDFVNIKDLKSDITGMDINFKEIQYKGPDVSLKRDLLQVFSRGQDEEYNGLSAGW